MKSKWCPMKNVFLFRLAQKNDFYSLFDVARCYFVREQGLKQEYLLLERETQKCSDFKTAKTYYLNTYSNSYFNIMFYSSK